jgi:hypothetical protein
MPGRPLKAPSGPAKGSRNWWRHPFYRSRWKKWHENWRKRLSSSPNTREDNPRALLDKLSGSGCDPEIAVRLAFLVASHKPATQSELTKDTRRQQRIKRKLKQAGQKLLDSARLLEEVSSDFRLVFISEEQIAAVDHTVRMCAHEYELLLEPRALELPGGHELFTMVEYVKVSTGQSHLQLMTDLLGHVYSAERQRGPTIDAVSKQVQRFKRPGSILNEVIHEYMIKSVNSGALKKDLLAILPGTVLP